MRSKTMQFSNFSKAITTISECFRPDNEKQLHNILSSKTQLARGNGLSYSDCCVNNQGVIVDARRLNHLLSFDESTGIVTCQGGVTFADLFLIHPDYIPPVIPGTLQATLAGGVANDVHGKNNPQMGTLGQHIQWLELQQEKRWIRLSPSEHADLFYATIGGLGLTGIITRLALKLHKASRHVRVQTEKHSDWEILLQRMVDEADNQDYQVAWLDFLNPPNALLSFANHCEGNIVDKNSFLSAPNLPVRLVKPWGVKWFNRHRFSQAKTSPYAQSLMKFNNPLDSIQHWNRLYGKKGLLQFQAVFDADIALDSLNQIFLTIQTHQATPTLTVLKYFNQSGVGLLSFAKPGFTLATDFINNDKANHAIKVLNTLITKLGGRIYLAKDLLLTQEQFAYQYPNYQQFMDILSPYHGLFQSCLAKRLGLLS